MGLKNAENRIINNGIIDNLYSQGRGIIFFAVDIHMLLLECFYMFYLPLWSYIN